MSHKPGALPPPPVIQARVRAPHVQAALVRAAQAKLPERPPSQGRIQQGPVPPLNRPSQAAHVQQTLAAVQAKMPEPPRLPAVPKHPAQAPAASRTAVAPRASPVKLPGLVPRPPRPGSSAIQRARDDDDDFPPLSSASAPISRTERKRLVADSKAEVSFNDPATWWALFGLTDSHAEAKTLGIDNYDTLGAYAVHVTLYKVNSHPVFFLRLTEDQILDQLLGSEQDAQGAKGIHVTWENSARRRPKCFRGGVFVPAGLDAATRTALAEDLERFLDSARTAIRHQKGLEGPLDLRPIHEW
jgi:hypothetical protein